MRPLPLAKFNHTRWRVCGCLIRRDDREKSAMQARRDACEQSAAQAQRDACTLSTSQSQARRDTCEQQGRPCSPGSELFDLHAPAAARLAHNLSINGLLKHLDGGCLLVIPWKDLHCSCFQLVFCPNLNCHIGQRIIQPQLKWQRIIRRQKKWQRIVGRQIYNGAENNCLTYSG